jgi:nucleoid-associated protein YgaU
MDTTTRIGIACLSLVVLWIVVYWATPAPAPEQTTPRVTFQTPLDQQQPAQTETPEADGSSEPVDPDPIVRPDPDPVQPVESESDTAEEEEESEPRPGQIIPPTFVDYTVQDGDNAWSIAERFYGSREYWAVVMLSNPTVDARRLFRVGRVIKLAEDPQNIQGIRAGQEPPPAPRMEFIEYRVESGDSLSAISQSIYGRAGLWRLIQTANADQVNADGTNLRPGMILKIPPPPAD